MFASIPACSNQGYQDPELEEYMTKRSSDGTVVTERPVPFSDVDAALLVVKNRGKTKNGDPIIGVYYGGTGQLVLNLTPAKETWAELPYGVDRRLSGKFIKSDLAINGAAGEEYEKLCMTVNLSEEAAKLLRELDAKACEQLRAFMPDVKWNDAVKDGADTNPPRFNPKLIVACRQPELLTKFLVRPFEQPAARGAGVPFLKPLLDAHGNFWQAKAKVAVRLNNIWINGDMAGIAWQVTELVADLQEKQAKFYEEAFGDDVFDQ